MLRPQPKPEPFRLAGDYKALRDMLMTFAPAARPDVSQLAMIALYPERAEAEALAKYGTNAADTMHVTMVFLGDVANIDMKAAAKAVGRASGSTAPMTGTIGGVGVFAAGDDGYPLIAIPNVNGLAALRALLVQHLAEGGVESPSEHDWVPHVTLGYADEPALPDVAVIGLPLTFNQLSLVVNDERKDFPLDPQGASDDAPPRPTRAQVRRRSVLLARARAELGGR